MVNGALVGTSLGYSVMNIRVLRDVLEDVYTIQICRAIPFCRAYHYLLFNKRNVLNINLTHIYFSRTIQ
jgi:hypothetical protein